MYLRLHHQHASDAVLDTKKNVSGTIISINGTTANILLPGSTIPQSWVKLAGLAIVRPIEQHTGSNIGSKRKHQSTVVINSGAINDDVINDGAINDDVTNDNTVYLTFHHHL